MCFINSNTELDSVLVRICVLKHPPLSSEVVYSVVVKKCGLKISQDKILSKKCGLKTL